MTYRFYLTDAVNAGNQHKYLTIRYADIVKGKLTAKEEKSGDEIAAEIIAKAGLVVK